MDARPRRRHLVSPREGALAPGRSTPAHRMHVVRAPQPGAPQLLRRVRTATESIERHSATRVGPTLPGATPPARCRRSSLPPGAPAPRAAKASTTKDGSLPSPSRDRKIRSSDRRGRQHPDSFRTDAAAGHSGRTAHPHPSPRPSRADRTADTGSAQPAPVAAISFRQT